MKIALGIEYNGHGFYGWQSQQNLPTIQGHLQEALSKIADEPIHVFCAGRTDAGVHATEQVVHFVTNANRIQRAWILGTNSFLPANIAVAWAETVADEFHARFSALSRCYQYIICNRLTRPAILTNRITWYYEELNLATMQQAANYLIGELDFSSFRSAECESKTPMRNVKRILINRYDDYIVIEIEANAFLHHMVRNIVGMLLRIGAGYKEPEWMHEVLMAKDRRLAAETASPAGLYLAKVTYPTQFALPQRKKSVLLI